MRRLHSSALPGRQVKINSNGSIDLLGKQLFVVTTAITSGSTLDPVGAVNGDFIVTTNATGRNKLFASDGTHAVAVGDGAVTPAANVASVVTANAATQSGSYVQADVQSIAALSNANKTAINAILTALQGAGLMS